MGKDDTSPNADECDAASDGAGEPSPKPKQQTLTDPDEQSERQGCDGVKGRLVLLLISAFLYSLQGLFLQFTSDMGIPSNEMVFLRSVFQGTFVVIGMIVCRVDDTTNSYHGGDCRQDGKGDIESGVDMASISGELSGEEKKLDDEAYANETATLLPKNRKSKVYDTWNVQIEDYKQFQFRATTVPHRIIWHPFGTTREMCNTVALRGIIGGFGFVNYYYTLSTLPLGDATTLLSLYPILTIFLARALLGEEIKPLHLVAAVGSIVGATLIARPVFLFGDGDEHGDNHVRPPALGYISAIVGSMCASGVIVLIRKAGRVGAHTLQLLFSWTVFGILFSLLAGAIAGSNAEDQQWRVPTPREMPYVLGVCVAGMIGHFLLNYTAKLLPATLSGMARSSDIGWSYLLEVVVLKQQPETETWLGVLFVASSLLLVLLSSNDKIGAEKKQLGSVGNLTLVK
jgi:drug/metabolite transporter (DMT)-like permease